MVSPAPHQQYKKACDRYGIQLLRIEPTGQKATDSKYRHGPSQGCRELSGYRYQQHEPRGAHCEQHQSDVCRTAQDQAVNGWRNLREGRYAAAESCVGECWQCGHHETGQYA